MYRILGADQKEYGPVTADQILRWIDEGRAIASTLAKAEGSAEWKPLSAFPEFATALQGSRPATPGGSPPPLSPPPLQDSFAEQILARDYDLNIGHCVSRSWNLVTQNFWLLVGASFIVILIQGAVPLLWGPLEGGLFWLFLRLIRGEKAEFGDAFAGFNNWKVLLPLFLAGLVIWILTVVGLIFCILPGIYLYVAWKFALPLIIDKHLDFWPAMEASRRIIQRHWWLFFGLMIVNVLIYCLGVLVCCIGVYIALPVMVGALAYAYEDIVGAKTAPLPQPR